MQALDQHDLSRAEAASAQFDAELWRISDRLKDEVAACAKEKGKKAADAAPLKLQVMPDALPDPLLSSLSVMSLELRAGVLVAKNLTDNAKKLYAQAEREEKALGYREPPIYIRPVGESEGAAFMAASDWIDAKAAYKEALVERPRSGFPLYAWPWPASKLPTSQRPRRRTRTSRRRGNPLIPIFRNSRMRTLTSPLTTPSLLASSESIDIWWKRPDRHSVRVCCHCRRDPGVDDASSAAARQPTGCHSSSLENGRNPLIPRGHIFMIGCEPGIMGNLAIARQSKRPALSIQFRIGTCIATPSSRKLPGISSPHIFHSARFAKLYGRTHSSALGW
jgi:hypothetical protein